MLLPQTRFTVQTKLTGWGLCSNLILLLKHTSDYYRYTVREGLLYTSAPLFFPISTSRYDLKEIDQSLFNVAIAQTCLYMYIQISNVLLQIIYYYVPISPDFIL